MAPTSRKRPAKTRQVKSRPKRGDDYQLAVARVAKSIDPAAQVRVGTWVAGPGGRRDLDVAIQSADGQDLLALIECKDWNKPIGIAVVDQLDSKRHDIGARVAMICSNSGSRLMLCGRLGVWVSRLWQRSSRATSRIRVVVKQQIYTRLVTFKYHRPVFHHQPLTEQQLATLAGVATQECKHAGKSMEAWVAQRLFPIAGLPRGRAPSSSESGFESLWRSRHEAFCDLSPRSTGTALSRCNG